MKIKKILNQNAVLVLDEGQEKIAIGKGIGFNKKRNDLIFHREIERLFTMAPESQEKLQTLLSQIDEKFFFATEKIIDHAETVLMEKLNEHLLIALADHISFSAENIQNGIIVKNRLLKEIEVLYSEEFSVAQWAVDYLNKELHIPYSYDEAGFIAIHIHSARSGQTNNSKSIREVSIVTDIISLIERELEIDIHSDKMSLNYSRLANHLRLLIQRFQHNQYAVLDNEIIELVKQKYPESYEIGKKVRVLLMKKYQLSITGEELGYIAIHIERLRIASLHEKNNQTDSAE
ncbi:beta-glucoside operon transcriptional antiterminator [Enterococcus sp. PF1-24]|uniref:PRD domain-containing protein n=1 Tax=unclassified Enterococcus TaxID=2608891 RepID=UPI002476AF79|nr:MULTISPECIES: PRD domain-containing protein [unclassified Enterococcus]MDH6365531.1 beta-glucoside operon transcriptional antiterminator [Enterococcus sp. PFB1-1]MDH6402632.1 beta-glucoside operon transcriptional antiterminator [Enterococcus sp. PF1-24]